ncbi:unnamed protein product [Periconia digitata]|uniref:Uncharacterized protein n=1 Tax=Periconia digitata TaxID=1303443 RepID=A0A9W4UA61_9PLEO|nr:unnamed protein product [Periconia digitata]
MLAHTVASVGPYTFQTDSAQTSSWAASRCGSLSPPHTTLSRRGSPFHPASKSICQVTGVPCIMVIS